MTKHEGVLVVVICNEGRVQATAADFAGGGAGARREVQQVRACDTAWAEVIAGHCSEAFSKMILGNSGFLRHRIREEMLKRAWTETVIDVLAEPASAEGKP